MLGTTPGRLGRLGGHRQSGLAVLLGALLGRDRLQFLGGG
jgi:hypothetical protein